MPRLRDVAAITSVWSVMRFVAETIGRTIVVPPTGTAVQIVCLTRPNQRKGTSTTLCPAVAAS